MKQQKVRTYIQYAIGEIALVVVGILIALQVNNWNVDRQEQKFLDFSLREIHTDLKTDLRLLQNSIEPRLRYRESGLERIYGFFESGKVASDSVFFEAYNDIRFRFLFTPTSSSYEVLKDNGLDVIDSEQLRNRLIFFYEIRLPRYIEFIHGNDELLRTKVDAYEEQLFDLKYHNPAEGDPHHDLVPKNDNYLSSQLLRRIVELLNDDARHKKRRLTVLEEDYLQTAEQLEAEMRKKGVRFEAIDTTKVMSGN